MQIVKDNNPYKIILGIENLSIYFSSAILSLLTSLSIYKYINPVEIYTDFTVGSITWNAENKFHDYLFLYSFITFYILFLALNFYTIKRIAIENNNYFVSIINRFSLYLLSPALYWFVSSIFIKDADITALYISGALLIFELYLLNLLILSKSIFYFKINEEELFDYLKYSFLIIIFSIISCYAVLYSIMYFFNQFVSSIEYQVNIKLVFKLCAIAAFLSVVWLSGLIANLTDLMKFKSSIIRLLLVFQLPIPFLYLVLIPKKWFLNNTAIQGVDISNFLYFLVLLMVTVSYISLFIKFRKNNYNIRLTSYISSLSIIAILLIIKSPEYLPQSIPIDDYHFGEFLTPWVSLYNYGQIPFYEFTPARGMINYLDGLFSSIFFDGTAINYYSSRAIQYLFVLLITFPVIKYFVGPFISFFIFLFMPFINGLSEIDIFVTFFICFLCYLHNKVSSYSWIIFYALLSLAILVYAPGQGGLAIIATFPIFIYKIYELYAFKNLKIILLTAFILLLIVLSIASSHFGHVVYGALRYGIEQSSINSVAHGIPWINSFSSGKVTYLFEIFRSLWILIPLLSGSIIFYYFQDKKNFKISSYNFLILSIFILSSLYVIRAAGRIDAGSPSRLGFASVWCISMLMPILLFSYNSLNTERRAPYFFLIWFSFSGMVGSLFGASAGLIRFDILNKFNAHQISEGDYSKLAMVKNLFPNMGAGYLDEPHKQRLSNINFILRKVTSDNETYLDLTNRVAQYFYLIRNQPIETGAIYNLVGEKQQNRSINFLERMPPPAVLVSADNMLFDGGGASLRSYYLYKKIILDKNYSVVKYKDQVWLIKKDRINNIQGIEGVYISDLDDSPDSPINVLFNPVDLKLIPSAWGKSSSSLSNKLITTVSSAEISKLPLDLHDLSTDNNEVFIVTGEDPYLSINTSSINLEGKNAGILSLSFSCDKMSAASPNPVLDIRWVSATVPLHLNTIIRLSASNGNLLIPMDVMPSWLLTKNIQFVRLDLEGRNACRSFSLKNISFMNRISISD